MNTPKFGRVNRTRIIMIVMIAIVVVLLIFVGILWGLTRKNKNGNKEPKNTPTPTQEISMVTATPTMAQEIKTTPTPTTTVTTKTPTPTAKPTATPVPTAAVTAIAGLDTVPQVIRQTVGALAEEAVNDVEIWGGSKAKNPRVTIETFSYPAYVSVLMTCTADGTADIHREAYTFDKNSGDRLAANQVFRETYLAVIKERLQTYAAEKDETFKRTGFVSYDEAYKADDYNNFFIHDDKVTFVFGNGSLIELTHKEFTFDAELSEATAFMYRDVNGYEIGYQMRTNLDPTKPMIAITFDDGPYEKRETQLLEIFDRYNAKCTFFSIGERIDGSKAGTRSIKAIAEKGHEVGSHTYSHVSFKKEDCDKESFWTEINKNNLVIAKAIGYAPTLIRMPGGNDKLDYMAKHLPMPMINWFLDTRDWDGGIIYPEKNTEADINAKVTEVSNYVIDNVKDGQIVLMHSLYYTSAEACNEIMATLSAQGYQFVTVSELFYYKGITLENGRVSYSTTTAKNYNRNYSKN